MKIVYEVRLYDTPLLVLILEEKKKKGGKGLGLAAVIPSVVGDQKHLLPLDLQLLGVGILA